MAEIIATNDLWPKVEDGPDDLLTLNPMLLTRTQALTLAAILAGWAETGDVEGWEWAGPHGNVPPWLRLPATSDDACEACAHRGDEEASAAWRFRAVTGGDHCFCWHLCEEHAREEFPALPERAGAERREGDG